MAGLNMTLRNDKSAGNNLVDEENLEKILTAVVKRRKTIPIKCMEISKKMHEYNLLRLENARVVVEENKDKDDFKRLVHEFKRSRDTQFTLSDLQEAEAKLEKYYKRTKEIHTYLEHRKKFK